MKHFLKVIVCFAEVVGGGSELHTAAKAAVILRWVKSQCSKLIIGCRVKHTVGRGMHVLQVLKQPH